jgi:hypothetical protein
VCGVYAYVCCVEDEERGLVFIEDGASSCFERVPEILAAPAVA